MDLSLNQSRDLPAGLWMATARSVRLQPVRDFASIGALQLSVAR